MNPNGFSVRGVGVLSVASRTNAPRSTLVASISIELRYAIFTYVCGFGR
jgi:hypothetical protein